MIKVNVIINNNNWFKEIKNPVIYTKRKIDKINKSDKVFLKKKLILHYYFQAIVKLKTSTRNLEKKINQQIFYLFLFKQEKN